MSASGSEKQRAFFFCDYMAEGRELMAERHSKSEYRTSDQDKEWFRSESF